ncbi:MAG: isoprenyl transferase [Anaerohalosphaeraceae bacterium]|nr:isoprenyl transferase [Anaerohalosphaeraceae bacterium]
MIDRRNLTIAQKRAMAAERLGISVDKIPKHVAVIMDGNGRWATQRGKKRLQGHRQGGKMVERVVLHGVNLGLSAMTLYSFSMQNWKRPKLEIAFLMQLYVHYLVGIRKVLNKHNVRLVHLGRTEQLPTRVVKEMQKTVELTSGNTGMVLALALNYGSREEIVDATKKISQLCIDGKLSVEDIDEELFSNSLYTAGLDEPDLLVRTSYEMRISNFLLWQISYAEFYVTETLWPDFNEAELDKAVLAYAARSRRKGDVVAK